MRSVTAVFSRLKKSLRESFCWDRPFARNVFLVALPMVLQSLVESSLHIVDGLMVSGLGDVAYSAVTQANRFSFVFNLFNAGVFTGGAIYLSQYWGAKDIARMRWSMGVSLLFAMVIASFFTLGGLFFPQAIASCFLPAGESLELSARYLRIVAPGYLFSSISGVFATGIKSGEKTHLPMISGMVGIACNTLLNYLLIFGKWGFPKMGVEGAALATVISAFVSMCLNLFFAYGFHLPAGAKPAQWLPREKGFAAKYIKTTVPVIFNEGLWGLGTTMYSVFYGRMGDAAVATMGVCNTINDLVWVIIFALMNATAIIIGKTLGTGNRDKAYLYAKRLIAGSMLSGVLLGIIVILFRSPMVNLFSGLSQQVRSSAETILVLGAATIWFRAFNTVNIVGVLRSGGDTVFSLVMDAGTLWLIGVPVTGLAALVLHWPLEWVFLCTLSEEVVKMLIGLPRFRSRKWMNVLTQTKDDENAAD